MNKITYLISS